jgi:hypothetical protein
MPYTYPSLTPYYGLGSYGRTGAAVLISSPRNKVGSQGRIYSWYRSRGLGQQYINFLLTVLPRGNSNPRNNLNLIGF